MKIIIFSILILLFLVIFPINEAQRQIWNHFWAIGEGISGEGQQQIQQQYTAVQNPVINNNYYATMYDPKLYKLEKKPFGGPFGETEFEYVLRRW